MKQYIKCPKCAGSGSLADKVCPQCAGVGRIVQSIDESGSVKQTKVLNES